MSDGLVEVHPVPLNSDTFECRTKGENVNESPMGLNMMVGKKLGALPRPSATAPNPPDKLTNASRENWVSAPKRPASPVSVRKKPLIAKLALSPPPKSSEPENPYQDVVMPPLPTADLLTASPAILIEPTYASTRPEI